MYLWCSFMSMYIYRRAWRSPFNIIWCGGSISSIQWCGGYVLDLWCQSVTSEVPLGAKNPFGTFKCTLDKYCIRLMSGLGSGMPQVYQWWHKLQWTSRLMSLLNNYIKLLWYSATISTFQKTCQPWQPFPPSEIKPKLDEDKGGSVKKTLADSWG